MKGKRRTIARFQICSHLHAMSDFGFASGNEPTGPSGLYSRSRTNNAECYAEECHNRGRCLIAVFHTLPNLEKELKSE